MAMRPCDFRDAEAIAEAVQRPTMKFVAIKTVEQLDLQGLHRIRERLVCQRTSVINQIRAFLLERGIAVRQGARALRSEMSMILDMTDKLSPSMIRMIEDLCADWRYLDGRIESVSKLLDELQEALAKVKADDKTRSDIAELAHTLQDNLNKIVQHGKRADSIVKNMLLHSRA